jgi:hypothetical protein
VSVDADYRVDPNTSFGLELQYQEFVRENNGGVRGVAMNLGATHHLSPRTRGDAWARAGAGYRILWVVDPPGALATTNMYHGFDVFTLKVGYDIRTGSDVAFGPVIGADAQMFVWQNADAYDRVQFGGFVYAGIQGRFDTNQPGR